jgi:predicted patatin/cPLA2 family phospholipase
LELKIPTQITATDMVGTIKIFEAETKISDALLASSAFPGIISPYEINGEPYSDGGILNHFLRIYYKVNVTYYRCLCQSYSKIEAKI